MMNPIESDRPSERLDRELAADNSETARFLFLEWCDAQSARGPLPGRGRTYAALVTLDRLRDEYNLDRKAHMTSSGAQVKRQTAYNVKKILSEFNETRPIPSEAGRTNSGSPRAVEVLLNTLKSSHLDEVDSERRNAILTQMMRHLVEVAGEYAKQDVRSQHIPIEYDPTRNASQIISDALDRADSKAGAVAQHLVGAKLQLRLPDLDIANHAASTADVQTGRRGDFEVNDTIFHVTVAPNDGHYTKCAGDIRDGFRVYLLVRDDVRVAAEQIAHKSHSDKIAVQSIESFIGQNLDELAEFSKKRFERRLRALLERYNERVAAVESDKSLLLDIPEHLGS
jgi:hypothetical protein